MKNLLLILTLTVFYSGLAQKVRVEGYYKTDGTYVRPHYVDTPKPKPIEPIPFSQVTSNPTPRTTSYTPPRVLRNTYAPSGFSVGSGVNSNNGGFVSAGYTGDYIAEVQFEWGDGLSNILGTQKTTSLLGVAGAPIIGNTIYLKGGAGFRWHEDPYLAGLDDYASYGNQDFEDFADNWVNGEFAYMVGLQASINLGGMRVMPSVQYSNNGIGYGIGFIF